MVLAAGGRLGAEVTVPADYAGRRFPSQATPVVGRRDRSELAELGVEAVTLMEGERTVYGPMSLSA